MTKSASTCRVFVIMARDANLAAVLRRGPRGWYRVIKWNTATDSFEDGAWFRGRIYEEKCDVSPDGELLIAFCHQNRKVATSYTDSWTAVSRLPWLHALALWPAGTTYGGGGRFTGPRSLVLRGIDEPHPDHPPRGLDVVKAKEYPPHHESTDEVEGATWSGRDHGGQIVYARAGVLFRRRGFDDVVVRDLNGMTPEPVPAPEAARVALSPSAKKRRGRGRRR